MKKYLILILLVIGNVFAMKTPIKTKQKKQVPTLVQLALPKAVEKEWPKLQKLTNAKDIIEYLDGNPASLAPNDLAQFITLVVNKYIRESKLNSDQKIELIEYLISKYKLLGADVSRLNVYSMILDSINRQKVVNVNALLSKIYPIVLKSDLLNETQKRGIINELLKLTNLSKEDKSFLTWLKEQKVIDVNKGFLFRHELFGNVKLIHQAAAYAPQFLGKLLQHGASLNPSEDNHTVMYFLLYSSPYEHYVQGLKDLLKYKVKIKESEYKKIINKDFIESEKNPSKFTQGKMLTAVEIVAANTQDQTVLQNIFNYAQQREQDRKEKILSNLIQKYIQE